MCIVTFCLLGLVSYSGTGLLLLLYLLLLMSVLRHITEGLQNHVKHLFFVILMRELYSTQSLGSQMLHTTNAHSLIGQAIHRGCMFPC